MPIRIHLVAAGVFVAALVVQVFLAGASISAQGGSDSFATKRVGAVISSRRLFGVGKSTSNSSMDASSPQLLNSRRSHSELSLP